MFSVNTMQNVNKFSPQYVALCLTDIKYALNLVLYLAARLCDSVHSHISLLVSGQIARGSAFDQTTTHDSL